MEMLATTTYPLDIKSFLDPMRDPAWRAVRAQWLVESGSRPKPPQKRDDEIVRKYRRFLMEWRKGGERRERLFVEDPGLYYAHQFYHHPDREWRAIVEAKILAREEDAFIAAEFSTCIEAIKYYHDLFFDVRDRLHSRMYITKIVLGPSARRISAHDDVMTDNMQYMLYKSFAYFGGPLVLDCVVTGFNEGTFPTKPNQVGNWFDETFKNTIKRRSNMAAQTFTVDRWKVMELLGMHVQLLAQQQAANAAGGGGPTTEYHQNIEMFFDQMPVAIGAKAREGRTPELLHYEQTASEPRADEMLKLSEGTVVDTLKGSIEFEPTPEEEGHDKTNGQEV